MINVVVPLDMWDEDMQGVIVSWLYENGAMVNEGDPVCEVMVEKMQADVIAQASGQLTIIQPAEAVVDKGQIIATIS